MKTFSIPAQFKSDADDLINARDTAHRIHGTNIRAAGNEVEQAVRDYFKRMLPSRYYVTNGHLIDYNSVVSPQQDIIIADNFRMPSLLTTKDGTEYVPLTFVYAIGEVKSTYYHSEKDIEKLHRTLTTISGMARPLIENTCQDGEINDNTTFHELLLPLSSIKYRNRLFSFLIYINSGDFDINKLKPFISSVDPTLLPNIFVFLDRGSIVYAKRDPLGQFNPYPGDASPEEYDWCLWEGIEPSNGSQAGAHLAWLYHTLLTH